MQPHQHDERRQQACSLLASCPFAQPGLAGLPGALGGLVVVGGCPGPSPGVGSAPEGFGANGLVVPGIASAAGGSDAGAVASGCGATGATPASAGAAIGWPMFISAL